MIYDSFYVSLVRTLLKAWQRGERRVRTALVAAMISLTFVVLALALVEPGLIGKGPAKTLAGVFGLLSAILVLGVISYQGLLEEQAHKEKIQLCEERVREHPEKPQFAWDLARTKLESYLDRNLSQVRSIFWLTLVVMLCGFGFVLFGLLKAFDAPEKLPVSLVASASGVLISFIGGSFLLIYRSILSQSKEYVTVLERINAVGMAVQVIASISAQNDELKQQTTAELAKQLLSMYGRPSLTAVEDENGKG